MRRFTVNVLEHDNTASPQTGEVDMIQRVSVTVDREGELDVAAIVAAVGRTKRVRKSRAKTENGASA